MVQYTKGMHDKDFLLDWDTIIDRKLSKKRLTVHHYPPDKHTVDYALPQAWLNEVAHKGDLGYNATLFTTVWLYPDKSECPAFWLCGIPAVLCSDTARQLDRLNIPYYTPRGYHGQPMKKENDND